MGNEIDSKASDKSIFNFGKDEETLCGELSYKNRLIGWLGCSITGFVVSWILTFLFVASLIDVVAYALAFSFCQILNIAGSCFLSTPKGHMKAMKKKHRIIPSVLYICSIILTIIIATATGVPGLVIICVIVTTIMYYWYTISFIPFGTKILKKVCGACCDM